jgi:CRP-like cAMP-binding protein
MEAQERPQPTLAQTLSRLIARSDAQAKRLSLRPRQLLFDADWMGDHLFLVHQGQIRTYQIARVDAGRRLLEILGPEEWTGIESLAWPRLKERTFRGVAITAAVVTAMPAAKVLPLLLSDRESASVLVRELAMRLCSAEAALSQQVLADSDTRLLHTILRFSNSIAAVRDGDQTILHLTQQDLADSLGTTRETVSLTLNRWERAGLLLTGRSKISFSLSKLQKFAAAEHQLAVPDPVG